MFFSPWFSATKTGISTASGVHFFSANGMMIPDEVKLSCYQSKMGSIPLNSSTFSSLLAAVFAVLIEVSSPQLGKLLTSDSSALKYPCHIYPLFG